MSGEKVVELDIKPLSRFVPYAVCGVTPELMGLRPTMAIPEVLKIAGLSIRDRDLIELNVAFAPQTLAFIRGCKLDHTYGNDVHRLLYKVQLRSLKAFHNDRQSG
jgi:acetyl-CoA acetyltransferase